MIPAKVPLALLAGVMALAPASGLALEMKYRIVGYFTKNEVKFVGDPADQHGTSTYTRRGLCFLPKNEVGAYTMAGEGEWTKGKGTSSGESTCTLADGSSFSYKWTLKFDPLPGGLSVYREAKAEFVAGTGRYQGIKGSYTFTGRTYTPGAADSGSDMVVDAVARYTLPKKK